MYVLSLSLPAQYPLSLLLLLLLLRVKPSIFFLQSPFFFFFLVASMLPERICYDSSEVDDSANHNSRRYVEETSWVDAGASPCAAASWRGGGKRRPVEFEEDLQAQRFRGALSSAATEVASSGSSDEDVVVDPAGYDADVELGGASSSSSSSSISLHCASTSELLSISNDGSASGITQLKRRRYVEEIWFQAGVSSSAARREVVVHGGGKRRLVAIDDGGDPGRELQVGAVKRFNGGWHGVLVSARPIAATEASAEDDIDSGGYRPDAESGPSSSAEADEEETVE